jgi:hypothetical protein
VVVVILVVVARAVAARAAEIFPAGVLVRMVEVLEQADRVKAKVKVMKMAKARVAKKAKVMA